jgi:signal transduction histidine kinase
MRHLQAAPASGMADLFEPHTRPDTSRVDVRGAHDARNEGSEHSTAEVELHAMKLLTRGAAHEINNLVLAILGQLALLAAELPSNGKATHRLERASAAGERIGHVAARMARRTWVESPETSPVDLADQRPASLTGPGLHQTVARTRRSRDVTAS